MSSYLYRVFFAGALLIVGASGAHSRELPNFVDLVEDNYRAVVNISTTRTSKVSPSLPPGMDIPDLPVLMMMHGESPKYHGRQIASEHRSEITVVLHK